MSRGSGGKLQEAAARLLNGLEQHEDPEKLVERTRARFPSATIETDRFHLTYPSGSEITVPVRPSPVHVYLRSRREQTGQGRPRQPAQHLVLIAPLIALQRRGRHRLPQQGRRAPMASHHRQHDRVLPVGRKTGPIQRNDHLRAGADDERRPVCEKGPDVEAPIAQEPIHLLHTMLGQRVGQAAPHCMDCQRSARQHATLANDSTRLACRSPSYRVMKFRRSCLRSHCPDEAVGDVQHPYSNSVRHLANFLMRDVVQQGFVLLISYGK